MTSSLDGRVAMATGCTVRPNISSIAGLNAVPLYMGPTRPIGRLADPIVVAKAVRFPASDEAGYRHGSSLIVDGGFTAQ